MQTSRRRPGAAPEPIAERHPPIGEASTTGLVSAWRQISLGAHFKGTPGTDLGQYEHPRPSASLRNAPVWRWSRAPGRVRLRGRIEPSQGSVACGPTRRTPDFGSPFGGPQFTFSSGASARPAVCNLAPPGEGPGATIWQTLSRVALPLREAPPTKGRIRVVEMTDPYHATIMGGTYRVTYEEDQEALRVCVYGEDGGTG